VRAKNKGISLEMEHTASVRDIVIFGVLISLLAVVIQDALSNFPFYLPLSLNRAILGLY